MISESQPGVITHFIAGYPSYDISLDVARGLIAGGAFALEMQIPFSDPSADGPVIEGACRDALSAGFTTRDAFQLLETIRSESNIPVFVMSYASLVFTPGVENFIHQAKKSGASGLIVPDLTPGADEGLFQSAAEAQCPAVPVIVPWISMKRLKQILAEPIEWVYAALRSGITGTYTEIGNRQTEFLESIRRLRKGSTPKVMAGFGIQRSEQIQSVTAADAVVVGSALVKAIARVDSDRAGQTVQAFVENLVSYHSDS